MRKVGDVSDYIDFERGKIVRNVKEVIFEDAVWAQYTKNNGYTSFRIAIDYSKEAYKCMSTILPQYSFTGSALNKECCNIGGAKNIFYFVFADSRGITVANINEYLAGLNAKVYYKLETPIEEDIILSNIPTIAGTNVITVIAGEISASNIEADF